MNSFFSYFTKNKIDPSWAYYLLVGIPVSDVWRPRTLQFGYATGPTLLGAACRLFLSLNMPPASLFNKAGTSTMQ